MSIDIKENVILAPFTIYKIGGPARFFAEVKNSGELKDALRFAAENRLQFFILGAGSNVLVSDKGFDGLVIRMNGGEIVASGESMIVDSGVMVARAVVEAAHAGLTGFEWAIGIPGTMGGSVRGNAGCFRGEIKDVADSVTYIDSNNGTIQKCNNSDCDFGYRDSIFKKHPEWIILSVTLHLKRGEQKNIQDEIKRITLERSQKQDIGTKSCGCIFKNVSWTRKDIFKKELLTRFPKFMDFKDKPNIPASFLIDRAGLKGWRLGRVFISPKHANYFINDGGASAEEVVILISLVKETVRKKFGILLEEEIQYVGFGG